MKIVIFGLTISSSWGNGHATIWRGICKALYKKGHSITFFEKDVPYYASKRDAVNFPGVNLVLYNQWDDISKLAETECSDSDAVIVTSYCPDGIAASDMSLSSGSRLKIFYDLDTPVTLKSLSLGETVFYLPQGGLKDFDLVLSYTGGKAVDELKTKLGARKVLPLYGCADPEFYKPVEASSDFLSDFSYLGTFAADRQPLLEKYFLNTASILPDKKFLIGGSLYPEQFSTQNIRHIEHVPPHQHNEFYCSSKFTLNITRGTMAEMGYCPSGRLFEASAAGVPIISDYWEGLEMFFEPGREIIVVNSTEDVIEALRMPESERHSYSSAARNKTLKHHSSEQRASELEEIIYKYTSIKQEDKCGQ